MKRFFFIASLAILAIGCQKTEVQNEVRTPIGFSTEVGKQTRAIVQDNTYPTGDDAQPFAVYAYGHQGEADATLVMDNVEISYDDADYKWRATGDTKYYWPNDPTTSLDFYAFSPYIKRPEDNTNGSEASAEATKKDVPHMVMTVESLSHTEITTTTNDQDKTTTTSGGLVFTGYTHSNMYVDFMEATPVKGAKYSDPDGSAEGTNLTNGTVPMTFNHKMTQILFRVTTDKAYPGVTFTVENITLKNIKNTADYNNGTWATVDTEKSSYQIFPANTANGAVSENTLVGTEEAPIALTNASEAPTLAAMLTTGVTMIPQTMVVPTTNNIEAGKDSYASEQAAQMFMITYSIEGTGVATETVTKHVPFRPNNDEVVNWGVNKKITYTVKIGLNEITFEPSVATWEDEPAANSTDAEKEKYEYTFQQ